MSTPPHNSYNENEPKAPIRGKRFVFLFLIWTLFVPWLASSALGWVLCLGQTHGLGELSLLVVICCATAVGFMYRLLFFTLPIFLGVYGGLRTWPTLVQSWLFRLMFVVFITAIGAGVGRACVNEFGEDATVLLSVIGGLAGASLATVTLWCWNWKILSPNASENRAGLDFTSPPRPPRL